jgi:peptidoglycan/xylan/chitin deacetylase (PgdA/CDA1 family)
MVRKVGYWLRLQAQGNAVRARIWRDGDPEPGAWLINAVDATYQTASGIGLTLYQHVTNADWDEIQARKLVTPEPTVFPQWGSLVWWDSNYGYRSAITVTNTSSADVLPARYSIRMTLDTAALVSNGQMRADCADLRIISASGSTPAEIDRLVEGCNTSQTTVWFALQRPILASGQDASYALYYGNPAATNPPANGMNVFLFYEDFEQGAVHWTSAGGLDPANTGTMGTSVISNEDFVSPANSQKFPTKISGGDAFSGYIPVLPSTGYAIGVWAKSPTSTNWGPVGIDPYTSGYIRGTEVWLWTSEWGIGAEWSQRSGRFVTGADTAYVKIKSELWSQSPGTPPIYMDNLFMRYSLSSEPTTAFGDEETILAVPEITNIQDNAPVNLGAALQVSANVSSSEGTVDAVMLRILSPETVDVPMALISGDNTNGVWQGSFTPQQGGAYHYRLRALASTGRAKLSEERVAMVVDSEPPQISLVSIIDPILVRNTQTVVVNVTDNGQVSQVTVTLDGSAYPMSQQGSQYSYSWRVTSVGVIPFIVTATDTSGNTATYNGSFTSQAREADVCTWKDCKSGAASFSMDDGNSACRAELEAAGLRGTYYYNGSSSLSWFSTYSAAGHEIASHTVGHPCNVPCCYPTCTPESLAACPYTQTEVDDYRQYQLDPNIQAIESATGKPVYSLAWPCGCTDPGRMQAASYYYLGARGYYDWVALLYWLQDVNEATPVNFMNLNTANSYDQTFIDRAIAEKKWAIITSHGSCDGIAYMGSRSEVLWNAPVGEVLRYIKVRDAAQFSNYSRVGRTISFDAAHNLQVFNRQTLAGAPLLPITFDNAVTLKAHILDTDTVLSVEVDGVVTPHSVIQEEGTRYVIFNASLDTLRHVTIHLAEPAPTIESVTDNGPVEVGNLATVTAVVSNPDGDVQSVVLRLVSPQQVDLPMTPVAGQPNTYRASFVHDHLGAQSYRVRASNSQGVFSESALYSILGVDTTPPLWSNQMQQSAILPPGEANLLSADGLDLGGLERAILMTDESGAWQEFDLPVSDWWNYAWAHRRAVVVNETAGLERQYETVEVAISANDFPGLTSCANELRVADANKVETPSQVYNERLEGGVLACNLLFQADVPPNGSRTYYIYYGNPSATPPTYHTDLTSSAGVGVTTVSSSYFNLDLDNDSAVISRLRLPQGGNVDLPLSPESDWYWGWHQVCSSTDGNISGKNSLCVGGTAPASGLTLQNTINGPLVKEYKIENVKGAAVYRMAFRFFAHAPYYQYTLSREGTSASVMNNFWYANGYYPRLGIGTGGTPSTVYHTYAYGADQLRVASFAPIDVAIIDGMDNDGADLGGTEYRIPTAPGLALWTATGATQADTENVLARIAAPLGVTLGANEDAPVGVYGSPIFLHGATGQTTAAFTWRNPAMPVGSVVQWRVKFCDLSANCAMTDVMSFIIQEIPPTETPTPTSTETPTPTETLTPTPTETPTPTPTPATNIIFADGFESGDLTAWTSSATDGDDLSVSAAAAMLGAYGMQARLDDTRPIYVRDDRPQAEKRYKASFWFDVNSLSMANNDHHLIFQGYDATNAFVLRLALRYSGGEYQVQAQAVTDAGGYVSTAWLTLSDEPHQIMIDYRAATGAGANDGVLELWLDGVQRYVIIGIDNDTRNIESVRLGGVSGIDIGSSGVYYFDEFSSTR